MATEMVRTTTEQVWEVAEHRAVGRYFRRVDGSHPINYTVTTVGGVHAHEHAPGTRVWVKHVVTAKITPPPKKPKGGPR